MGRQSMRDEIVEAALEQFHIRGYNGAGVKDVTDAAGVPKGSFYNHFPSKEALAIVALEHYGQGRRLHQLADRGIEPLQRLRSHFEFLRDETVRYGYTRGCLFGNFGAEIADHNDAIRTAIRDSLQYWAASIAATLADAQHAGTVRADLDPETTAQFLLSAWEGTLIKARADRSATAFDSFFEVVFGTLLAPGTDRGA
jgi:TetR/AcrR family transcriptional repressor of nem operon